MNFKVIRIGVTNPSYNRRSAVGKRRGRESEERAMNRGYKPLLQKGFLIRIGVTNPSHKKGS